MWLDDITYMSNIQTDRHQSVVRTGELWTLTGEICVHLFDSFLNESWAIDLPDLYEWCVKRHCLAEFQK